VNIVLFEAGELSSDHTITLTGRRCEHLQSVLKCTVGDQVSVGTINGGKGIGKVLYADALSLKLQVEFLEDPLPPHPTTVVLALPRPKMLRRILRSCAEFGIQDLHIVHSYRVEKSFWQSPLLQPQKIQQALLTGLERSGDTRLPSVTLHRRFKPFIQDHLEEIANGKPIFILHPGNYPSMESAFTDPQLIIIGPEGGFLPYEVDLACSVGAQPRSLGPRILSVDTAVPAILGRALR
jgi:RsmE family RNA methyltransferase